MTKLLTNIGIIGSGKMGFQVATLMAKQNYKVMIYTRNTKAASNKFEQKYFSKAGDSQFKNFKNHVNFTSEIKDLNASQLIIECISEELNIKKQVLAKLISETDSLIASCTSSFTLKELTENLDANGRLSIIHFSNPVAVMKVAEVVYSPEISIDNIAMIELLFKKINFKIFKVPDIPGFVINSIMFELIYKSITLHVDELVETNDIDELLKQGCGLPMGPFEIIRLVGSDTTISILKNLKFQMNASAINFVKSLD